MSSSRRLVNQQTVQSFSNIEVPEKLRTSYDTGWAHMNVLHTGTGIRPSTVEMITGLPGSGKTTACLQLADFLVAQGHYVQYNSCEESAEQIKMTLERLELKNLLDPANSERAIHSNLCEVGEILAESDKILAKVPEDKGLFLFVDSLQTIEKAHEGRGRPAGQQNQSCEAMWDIAEWCKAKYTVAFIIGQVTKDGTFAGKQEIKHCVDCHLHLGIDTDKKSDTYNQRIAEQLKNRFGISNLYFSYELTTKGLVFSD